MATGKSQTVPTMEYGDLFSGLEDKPVEKETCPKIEKGMSGLNDPELYAALRLLFKVRPFQKVRIEREMKTRRRIRSYGAYFNNALHRVFGEGITLKLKQSAAMYQGANSYTGEEHWQ